ncbi:LOW QUALITY PROTEIN: G-protein coupled receptor family C group 5 member C-like [Menidia menidia]
MATNGTPRGCGPQVDPLYFRLCDLDVAWGVAVEAAAAAGAVFCLVLLLALAASVPFVNGGGGVRPARLWLHAAFLLADGGLFGLAFAFVVGRDFATCASRRFLFGVLFAACFSCQLAAAARLLAIGRRRRGNGGHGGHEREPSGVLLLLGALALWLVEVVVNTEWLVLTVARYPPPPPLANATAPGNAAPCLVANQDFVMALVYVMALLAGVVAAGLGAVATAGGRGPARREGALILASGLLSAAVWAAWTAMFLHGNAVAGGGPNWDDPTLAIATATNAWVLLAVYAIPLFCAMSGGEEEEEEEMMDAGGGGGVWRRRGGGGYDNILKEKGAQNMFMENKAFSMDEPGQGSKPVSPYSGYSGQLRGSVYQPTELALISKAVGNVEPSFDMIIPRASAGSAATSGSSTPSSRLQAPPTPQPAGYGLNRSPQW